jgi:nitrite reductase/ring-hydroxylating ferredoxin subunit
VTDALPVRIDAGAVEDYASGTPRLVALPPVPGGPPRREAIVLRDAQGFRAFLNICRHLPIPLDGGGRNVMAADGRHFLCRTHGALYRISDGTCVQGPCGGQALAAVAVELDAGRVYLTPPGD